MRTTALLAALVLGASLAGCADDGGDKLEGTGFELEVPDGWHDESDKGDDVGVGGFEPEVVLLGEREEDFTTNVNVIVTPTAGFDLDRQVREERKLLETGRLPDGEQVAAPASSLGPVEPIKVDLVDARMYDFELPQDGETLQLRQVIAIHDGNNYAITLTAHPDIFEAATDDFDSLLESWVFK